MSSTVTIAVDSKGKTQISVKGTQGAACTRQTQRFAEALGVTTEEEKTADYYHVPEQTVSVKASEGGN